jgi:hypothetical protein
LEDDFEEAEGAATVVGSGKASLLPRADDDSSAEEDEDQDEKIERMQRSRPIAMRNPLFTSPLEVSLWVNFNRNPVRVLPVESALFVLITYS